MNNFEMLSMVLVGLVAGFINVLAGGGSTLSVPLLMMLGLDPHAANASNRVPVLCQTVSAVYVLNQKQSINTRQGIVWGLLMIPGAVLGVLFSLKISAAHLKLIILCAVVMIALISMRPNTKKKNPLNVIKTHPKLMPITLFAMGFYGGFIQIGVGFMFMALMGIMTPLSLFSINQYKVLTVSIYMVPVVIVFAIKGAIVWSYAGMLSIGFIMGSMVAARMALKKNEAWIKKVYFMALTLVVLKMLFDILYTQ